MSKSISVRLSDEAYAKCEVARKRGYTRTQFIEQSILELPYYNRDFARQLLPHFTAIAESIAAIKGNADVKQDMREELDAVCQFLRLHQDHT